ncbi:type I phosphodiesterase/nucleotide pyrophosphatase [Citrifermentans bemidjiense Bem]|uniref:Type I phosphodiesterase/nucleotide pyrophosphatase n=1 Tax=Citrifermentans bemidjiense (strain ATCC BAA-1014 / DSM 16622 / JCM 12645 / Bem) TaxID=404380 RepID=B5EAX7_CITBB|nr:nucleotide pyrophosphatase/phosphodiesterase family protein [Citrifermentans bemidjiense]ACH38838.1 type I phosphodiesterase/nucleotide pyrophosphatase [Citrifermentans bemidjiense Bem]
MQRTVVLNVVGLTRALIGDGTPRLRELLAASADIKSITPAVTCSVQSTYLTGKLPAGHGIVGNGWYFRDLGEVFFWRQSNRLVQGEKIWHEAKRRDPSFSCANTFWWYNMVTDVDYAITPRPLYLADGRKLPDCYSIPADLRHRFNSEFGQFPLFQFWGPATSIVSSDWIGKAAMSIEETYRPTLQLVYLPHLDYCLQKLGPGGDISAELAKVDLLCGQLLDFFRGRGCRVVVLSEYGITDVERPVHPNRVLREAGLLSLKVDRGREYLDPGTSRAFAVADHQVAHVYVRDPNDLPAVRALFQGVPGVEEVLDGEGKKRAGLDHERSGELVLVSDAKSWFTYYWWLDDARAPDYARTVNIHAKPGYDPCELFLDPTIRLPKVKIAATLAKKLLGFRYLMDVIPLDASLVRGSHGRVTDDPAAGPIFMTTEPKLLDAGSVDATEVYNLLLRHLEAD